MRSDSYFDAGNAHRKAVEWLSHIRRAVAPRPGLMLRPDQCALLVIDMLSYFIDPTGRSYLPAGAAILPNVRALLDRWRGMGGWVIYTRHGHQGTHDLGMLGKFFNDHIGADEPQSAIIPALEPHSGELVFRKTTYDAFLGTDLHEVLTHAGRTQVLLTGVLTHMCVETTARSAFCRGFEVYVPVDAVASTDEERHLSSLLNMADSVAVMLDTKEVLEACAANVS